VLTRYEIRIAGPLDEATMAAFGAADAVVRGDVTVITGDFDQAALHGLLERIRVLGLELVDVRRVRGARNRRTD
jgi:hypothetical protein